MLNLDGWVVGGWIEDLGLPTERAVLAHDGSVIELHRPPARRGRAGWTRTREGVYGSCGAEWTHDSGWRVTHCGHPTANYPFLAWSPQGMRMLHPSGRAFARLRDAQAAAERHVGGGA